MGHKGVAKRKPKAKLPSSKAQVRPGESQAVASLVQDKNAPVNRGGMSPSSGSNKKNKKAK